MNNFSVSLIKVRYYKAILERLDFHFLINIYCSISVLLIIIDVARTPANIPVGEHCNIISR